MQKSLNVILKVLKCESDLTVKNILMCKHNLGTLNILNFKRNIGTRNDILVLLTAVLQVKQLVSSLYIHNYV